VQEKDCGEKHMEVEKMLNKWERIQAIKLFGLNTEESILIDNPKLSNEQLKFIKTNKMFSLRTFSNDDNANHPHFPVLSRSRLAKEIKLLLECGYSSIVATCIDPRHDELVGCAYKRGASITIEVAYGAGTVRRVTHDGKIDKSFTTGVFAKRTGDRRLDYIISKIKRTPVDDCIFEFSWYKMPVGNKKQHMIFWEVTGANEKGKIKTVNGAMLKL